MNASSNLKPLRKLSTADQQAESERPSMLWQRLKITLVILLSIAGVLALSRFVLINNSLRLDEAQSMWQTSHSLSGTLRTVAADVHVPLYHVILHYWQIAFGQSIQTARILSLVFFILTIPLVYLLARRFVSVNWSLFATVVFSLSPFMNWYANEARMYTLLALVTTLSQLFFIKILQSHGRKGWLGWLLSAMVGVYSHYFFLFNLVVQGIVFLFVRRSMVKGSMLKLAAIALLLIAELTPWILYFRAMGSASNTSPMLPKPSTVDFFNAFSNFLFGFQNDAVNTMLVSLWPLLVVIALLFVRRGQKITQNVGYIIAAAFLPVLIAYAVSYAFRPFFLSRYMISCVPPLIVLLVWLISQYRRWLQVSLATVIVLVVAATSYQQYTSPTTPVKEDFRSAAQIIDKSATSSDLVVLSAPFSVYPFNYYYDGYAKVTTLPVWDRTVPGAIPAFQSNMLDKDIKGLNKGHQYIYLLLSSNQGYEDKIHNYYEQRFENTSTRQLSPDLLLEVYRVGYSEFKPAAEL